MQTIKQQIPTCIKYTIHLPWSYGNKYINYIFSEVSDFIEQTAIGSIRCSSRNQSQIQYRTALSELAVCSFDDSQSRLKIFSWCIFTRLVVFNPCMLHLDPPQSAPYYCSNILQSLVSSLLYSLYLMPTKRKK